MFKRPSAYFFGLAGVCLFLLGVPGQAQTVNAGGLSITVTKLWDFEAGTVTVGNGHGAKPYYSPVFYNNALYLTTNGGGLAGFGTLSKFDLTAPKASALTTLVSFDGDTGIRPQGDVTIVGNNIYYTTTQQGTGAWGAIGVYNMSTTANTVLYNSPTSTSGLPYNIQGGVTYVDRGNGQADIYALQLSGRATSAPSDAAGGIVKLTINSGTQEVLGSSVIHTFDGGAAHGRQPWRGSTLVGNKIYFTLATGGPVSTGASNGGGALGVIDLSGPTPVVNDALAFLPNVDGSYALPWADPLYDASRNALFVTTNGTSTQPGGILKFDLATNQFTPLFELSDTAGYPDGRYISGPVSLVEDRLFFATRQGGTNNGGAIGMFDLTTNTYIKLFDLTASAGNNLGGTAWGGFAVNYDSTGYHLYLTPNAGGTSNNGTILRIDVVPEPSSALLLLGGGSLLGLWRRRASRTAGMDTAS